jgi:PII-like signaling protein
MLTPGRAKKLVVYVNEQGRWEGQPIHEALLRFLHRHGCAGATVTKAVAGYGAHGELRESGLLRLRENLPLRIEVIESEKKLNALLPWVYEMVADGLIEMQDTEVIKCSSPRAQMEESHAMEHIKLEGAAKMLRIYIGENDRWEGEPLHDAIVKKLRMMDIAGATVYRGISGYGANQRVHKSGFLRLSHDLPIMITVVDAPEKITRAILALDEMVDEGLIVLSDVEVIKYVHNHSQSGPREGGDETSN